MSGTVGVGTITVPGFPTTWRKPGVYVGVDPSQANSGEQTYSTLIVGQVGLGSAAPVNQVVLSLGAANAATLYGGNSPLAQMVAAYRLRDPTGTVYELPIANAGVGTVAAGSIGVTGTATAAGTLFFYVGGQLIQVTVDQGDTAAIVLANIQAAIAAVETTLLLTALVPASGAVPLNATFAGATGNDIDVRLNYLGAAGGQVTPAGLTVTVTTMSGGTGEQPLAAALANLPSTVFNLIVSQQNDPTTMAAIKSFLSDAAGRWNAIGQLFGHAVYFINGSPGVLATAGEVPNDQHATVAGLQASPTPSFIAAANIAGVMLSSMQEDVSLPFNTLGTDILPSALSLQFTPSEQNTLLYSGISTLDVVAGAVTIDRLITTYRLNGSGQPDTSYLNAERLQQICYFIQDIKSYLSGLFGRSKLIADAARVATGSNVVNAASIQQAIVNRYTYLEQTIGLVQNSATFAQNVVVSIVNGIAFVRCPADFAGQLESIAIDLAFTSSGN